MHDFGTEFTTYLYVYGTYESGPSGLKWHKTTGTPPAQSIELTNAKLSEALQGKLEFTQAEWNEFDVDADLTTSHVIKADGAYFQPAAGNYCCSDWSEVLERALEKCITKAKEELTRHELIVAVSRSCQVVMRSLIDLPKTDIIKVINMIAPEIYKAQVRTLKICFDIHREIIFNIFLPQNPLFDTNNKDLAKHIDEISQKPNVNVYLCAFQPNTDSFEFMGHGNVQITVKSAFEQTKTFDLDRVSVNRQYFNRDVNRLNKYTAIITKHRRPANPYDHIG